MKVARVGRGEAAHRVRRVVLAQCRTGEEESDKTRMTEIPSAHPTRWYHAQGPVQDTGSDLLAACCGGGRFCACNAAGLAQLHARCCSGSTGDHTRKEITYLRLVDVFLRRAVRQALLRIQQREHLNDRLLDYCTQAYSAVQS